MSMLNRFQSRTSACSDSECETGWTPCLHTAVNKPACREGSGVMFQLETSTNRPKWMRENGSDSKQVPWGTRSANLLLHLPVLELSCPWASETLCIYFPSLFKTINLLPDPLHPREATHPRSHFQNHYQTFVYADLNSTSAVSSSEPTGWRIYARKCIYLW